MPINHWALERAGDLAECYNLQIADLPYCYPQSSEGSVQGIQEDLGYLFGSRRKDLHSEKMIVSEDGGSVTGFVHVGVEEKEEGMGRLQIPVFSPFKGKISTRSPALAGSA